MCLFFSRNQTLCEWLPYLVECSPVPEGTSVPGFWLNLGTAKSASLFRQHSKRIKRTKHEPERMCVLQKWKGNPYYKATVIKTGNGENTDTQMDGIE